MEILNSLDLLVGAFVVLGVMSIPAIGLMFLSKKTTVQKFCFNVAAIIGVYLAYVGIRINILLTSSGSSLQVAAAFITGAACILAFVSQFGRKGDDKKFLIARVITVAAVVIGFFNAFL